MKSKLSDLSSTVHKVPRPRQKYNQWVANETLEDFALRYTAKRARQRSFSRIANTALGTSSFLVLELLGATIALNYGVYHSLWAIVVVCSLLFISGIPISYYATKYSVDIDLLTRGAGFGYIGSTVSSLIYASFTFIFFALEATIMASALELLLGLPIWLGYLVSAVVVIPLVTHGIAMISRLQLATQPLWLLLQLTPIIYIAQHPEGTLLQWLEFPGINSTNASNIFNWVTFGAATTVLFALMAQIGEQVDFLRFMPDTGSELNLKKNRTEQKKWWLAVLSAGPGWVIFGALKLTLGTCLAFLLIQQGFSVDKASDPTYMYSTVFQGFSLSPTIALLVAAVFVIICQIKINVANAYAGSLAWSNFFSRLTHHHPGRVVWVVFNVSIALLLMELGVYRAIETVLHHYSVFVLAWFGSIIADLIINKPLGLSPKHIEFKRSQLFDINPVGVGSTALASIFGLLFSTGVFGTNLMAFSGFIAFFLPFSTVPLLALLTKSRYYLVTSSAIATANKTSENTIALESSKQALCAVCNNIFDNEDISHCPFYDAPICSLCCVLETRCKDQCRPNAHISAQLAQFFKPKIGHRFYQLITGTVGQFIFSFTIIATISAGIFYIAYFPIYGTNPVEYSIIEQVVTTSFVLILILLGVVVWLFVLAHKSTRMALQETNLQTQKLTHEVAAHKVTLKELERARRSADSANIAKSNYVTALSHELRTPLNVILGYAQLLQKDSKIPVHQRDNLSILHRNGEHLATMIEGLLEIAKIEAGRLNLNSDKVRLDLMLEQLVKMFRHQAESKDLTFIYDCPPNLPTTIRVDEKRLRQILINLLSNAVKFTETGSIHFSVSYKSHVARFTIKDTGYGIDKKTIADIFLPFVRGEAAEHHHIAGSGLGLAICRQLTDMMGADIEVHSEVGIGSTFTLLLQATPAPIANNDMVPLTPIIGYRGDTKTILIVDDNSDHRILLSRLLTPLKFRVVHASNAQSARIKLKTPVDLILLDVKLGKTSGWDFAKEVRAQLKNLPIIMVSANARGFYSTLPDEKLHNDYLEKPIQLDALLEKIAHLLGLQWMHELSTSSSYGTKNLMPTITESLTPTAKTLLQNIAHCANIGNANEISRCLTDLESSHLLPESTIREFHELIKLFNFGEVNQLVNKVLTANQAHNVHE